MKEKARKLPLGEPDPVYPKKESFYSMKLSRLMAKTVAATKIGHAAAYLVTLIASQEDSCRYNGPVVFHSEVLQSVGGFKTWDALNKARVKACEAGWLVYIPPGRGRDEPGQYWTTIPDGLSFEGDGYIGEPDHTEQDIRKDTISKVADDLKTGLLSICHTADGRTCISLNSDHPRIILGSSSDHLRIALYKNLLPVPSSSREKFPAELSSAAEKTIDSDTNESAELSEFSTPAETVTRTPKAPENSEPPADSVLTIPCVGNGPKVWHLTQSLLDEWREAYPQLDVLAACRKAKAWLAANSGKNKTHKGMPRFLVNWLSRETDRGTAQQPRTHFPLNGNSRIGPALGAKHFEYDPNHAFMGE